MSESFFSACYGRLDIVESAVLGKFVCLFLNKVIYLKLPSAYHCSQIFAVIEIISIIFTLSSEICASPLKTEITASIHMSPVESNSTRPCMLLVLNK